MKPLGPDIQEGRFGRELQCSALDRFIFVSNSHVTLSLNAAVELLRQMTRKEIGRRKPGADLQDPGTVPPILLGNFTLFFRQALLNISSSTDKKQSRAALRQQTPVTMSLMAE